jgi:hypothetical protein
MSNEVKINRLNKVEEFYSIESNEKKYVIKIDSDGKLHIYSDSKNYVGRDMLIHPYSARTLVIDQKVI